MKGTCTAALRRQQPPTGVKVHESTLSTHHTAAHTHTSMGAHLRLATRILRRQPRNKAFFADDISFNSLAEAPTGASVVAATAGAARCRRAAMALSEPAHDIYSADTGARCDQRTDSGSPARCEDATSGSLDFEDFRPPGVFS